MYFSLKLIYITLLLLADNPFCYFKQVQLHRPLVYVMGIYIVQYINIGLTNSIVLMFFLMLNVDQIKHV